MFRIIQLFVNLVIVILILYAVNSYVYSTVINIEKNLDNPTIVRECLHRLPNQMYVLFILGVVATTIIYIVHYCLNYYFKRKI